MRADRRILHPLAGPDRSYDSLSGAYADPGREISGLRPSDLAVKLRIFGHDAFDHARGHEAGQRISHLLSLTLLSSEPKREADHRGAQQDQVECGHVGDEPTLEEQDGHQL